MEQISPTPREQQVPEATEPSSPELDGTTLNPLPQNPPPKKSSNSMYMSLFVGILVVIAGVATGWVLAGGSQGVNESTESVQGTSRINSEVDEELFPDSEKGVLMKGGKSGEGTHYLDRGTGEENYVYLTSTVIDLESFVGQNVQVRGKTLSAQNVNYLMDVGTVKIVN